MNATQERTGMREVATYSIMYDPQTYISFWGYECHSSFSWIDLWSRFVNSVLQRPSSAEASTYPNLACTHYFNNKEVNIIPYVVNETRSHEGVWGVEYDIVFNSSFLTVYVEYLDNYE